MIHPHSYSFLVSGWGYFNQSTRSNIKNGFIVADKPVETLNLDQTTENVGYFFDVLFDSKADRKTVCKAIDDFDKVIKLKPTDSKVYYNRGLVNAKIKQYEDAIDDFEQAINLREKFYDAYFNRGTTNITIERYEQAILDFDRAIEFNPEFHEAYSNRGTAKLSLKRYDEALVDFW